MLPTLVIHTDAHVEIQSLRVRGSYNHRAMQKDTHPYAYKWHISTDKFTISQTTHTHTHTQVRHTPNTYRLDTKTQKKSLRDTGTYINYIQLPRHKEFVYKHTHPQVTHEDTYRHKLKLRAHPKCTQTRTDHP